MEAHGGGRAAVLVALVVLAGCGGPLAGPGDTATPTSEATPTPAPSPTTTPTPDAATPTATPEPRVAVETVDGELGVNASLLYGRVEELMNASVEPGAVTVRDLQDAKRQELLAGPAGRYLGVPVAELNDSRPAGLTRTTGTVLFDPGSGDPVFVERRLVHEFVHVVQLRGERFDRSDLSGRSYDAVTAWRAVAEGSAVYVTDAYVAEYMPGERRQSAVVRESYEAGAPPGNRVVWAPYRFGYRYVAERAASPANQSAVFENPPRTTEQVIHGYAPGEEPVAAAAVEVNASGEWRQTRPDTRGGELLVRTVLRAELSRERAADAAAGWGTDRLVGLAGADGDRGVAWVLRWDTPEGSEALAAALREYAAAREGDVDAEFAVRRADDRTVVLLAGTESFLAATEVAADGLSVTVSVGGATTAALANVSSTGRPVAAARPS